MGNALKQYLIQRKIISHQHQSKDLGTAVQAVLILYDAKTTSAEQLKKAFQAEFFEASSYTLQLIGFQKGLKLAEAIEQSSESELLISSKCFDWRGSIKLKSLQSSLKMPYQFCFNYFEPKRSYLQLVNAMSKSKFNIGLSCHQINKFAVNVPEDNPKLFFREVTKYITKINYEYI